MVLFCKIFEQIRNPYSQVLVFYLTSTVLNIIVVMRQSEFQQKGLIRLGYAEFLVVFK